ncbi:NmrA family NAD(P)-binding protein [[Pseudopropionibacterium] massiliense]|uniref:NmrA family NAD(P)-binding protein n=1 Tax=[Pseudopropionibacterium] massiliense TaxID=2220000 RepID=UPI001A9187C0|nr:NmrA family NAD(P)-binding protein [[Pseudopropionibacterium] massiliense]
MSAPDVLLLGATGCPGRHVAAELHRRGHRIRAVVRDARRAEKPGAWDSPALSGLIDEQIVGDVRDPDLPTRLTAGVGSAVSALGVTRQGTDP